MKIRLLMLGKTRRPEMRAVLEDYVKRIGHQSPIEIGEIGGECISGFAARACFDPLAGVFEQLACQILQFRGTRAAVSCSPKGWAEDLRDERAEADHGEPRGEQPKGQGSGVPPRAPLRTVRAQGTDSTCGKGETRPF